MAHSLTLRQREILTKTIEFIEQHGYSPSIRDIIMATDVKSQQGICCHLDALERKGYIARDNFKSRTIKVLLNPDAQPIRLAFVLVEQALSQPDLEAAS